MTQRQQGPLNQRERNILDVLVTMTAEAGLDHQFTHAHIAENAGGPCAGSLAGLVLKGYAAQRTTPEGIVYTVTEQGYMLYAGIEGQL